MAHTNANPPLATAGSAEVLCKQNAAEHNRPTATAQAGHRRPGLTWRRDGADWVLLSGRRRFGRVVPDTAYPQMWRSALSGGRLSDMANLSWAKNAVLVAAEREFEWEAGSATAPPNCPEKRGVLAASAPYTPKTGEGVRP
jgi:hypothetical protein